MSEFERALASHFERQRAMDLAWRWFRRSQAPSIKLSEIISRVHANCPSADPEDIQREFEARMSRTRRSRTTAAT
jgi:hypothetical protein